MAGLPGGCNPADVLFKLAHGRGIKPPVFEQVTEQGPPHAKTFTWSCSFFEGEYNSVGHGRSKKEARNAAAKSLITQLDLSKLPVKPNRPGNDFKRKMMPNVGESGETGEPDESIQWPKKRRGNHNRGMGFNQAMGPMPMGPMSMSGMGMGPGGFGGFMGGPMMYGGGMGMGFPGPGGYHGGRMWAPKRTFADKHVMDKHKSIFPEDKELNKILKTVDKVERSLKAISDKFFEDGDDSEREVTGVARVGDLAKSLLLRGDIKVHLVVMCSKKPTKSLLESLTQSLKKHLEEAAEVKTENGDDGNQESNATKFDLLMDAEISGFFVKTESCDIKVTLTSTLLRSNDEEEPGDADAANPETEEGMKTEKDPDDLLPLDCGLMGLAELRRAKWFAAMASPLPSCVEAIRIMKEMGRRNTAWGCLGDWATELLVERCLFSVGYSLSPSKSIMRIMEAVSSGLLLEDGPGLKDPCERAEVDACDHLTPQMRADVTRQAQADIRNIHYRKIHLVLGMEMIDRFEKKFKKEATPASDEVKDEELENQK